MGGSRHACCEERHLLWLLLRAVPRRDLHPAPEEEVLLLHRQPPHPLRPHIVPRSLELLSPSSLGGEGLSGSDHPLGYDGISANGGRDHAGLRKRASDR